MSREPRIKVKARAVIRRGDAVLLVFAIDPGSAVRYGRLLGGAVELGERAEETVRREIREEIGLELGDVSRIGVVENFYTWDARVIHEVIFVFEAEFADPAAYERESFPINEAGCDGPATWVSIARLLHRDVPLYPPELADLLDPQRASPSNRATRAPV